MVSKILVSTSLLIGLQLCSLTNLSYAQNIETTAALSPEKNKTQEQRQEPSTEAPRDAEVLDVSRVNNYANLYDQVYQIVVIETETNNKSALGSGFQISADGLVVTNYHVISNMVFSPDHHRAEYVDQHQETGELELLTFDVINDLAILRKADNLDTTQYFELATDTPTRGDSVYALGNPHDVGMLMVSGAYNGLADYSHADRILFSGSLNSGMSGGPTVNETGEVIGVNVSTAGSQLSFLVPVDKVINLIPDAAEQLSSENYLKRVTKQISLFQSDYFQQLMSNEWEREELGDYVLVPGEMGLDTNCWGRSSEDQDDRLFLSLSLTCNNSNQIYLTPSFNTGVLHYSFFYHGSGKVSNTKFYKLTTPQNFYADNRASKDEVTTYECEQAYLPSNVNESDYYTQTGFCTRAYTNLDGLYDVLFYSTNFADKKSFTSHFTLAGVSKETALSFTERFMEQAQWK